MLEIIKMQILKKRDTKILKTDIAPYEQRIKFIGRR